VMVCLGHRHQSEHSCALLEELVRPMAATKAAVAAVLAAAAPRPARTPRSLKAQRTAAKVQLMKLKMSSRLGDAGVPQAERLYLLVAPPRALGRPAAGAWVSSAWTVGRVVDSLAAGLGVDNRNNVAGADRLVLARAGAGAAFTTDMAEVVRELVDREEIFNGDSVILEYENSIE